MDLKRVAYLGNVLVLLAMAASRCAGQALAASDSQRQAAILLEQQGNDADAETAWRAVLQANPSNSEAFAHLGLLEARQQHYTQAIPLYRKALTLNPSMLGLQMNLGLAEFKSGDLKDAIRTFSTLLKTTPATSPEALRLTTLIGLADYGVGEYSAAVPYLKQAIVSDPQNLPFRLTLAQSCLWARQYPCVLEVYHQILDLNANSAEADMLAGEALDGMKNDAGAVEQFRAAAKADPALPNVHFGLGYLLWRLKQYAQAAPEFSAELANNPGHPLSLVYLADADMHLGHPDAAMPLLEKAVRIDPGIEIAHLDLGVLDSDAGHPEDAVRELKIAEKLTPGDVHVHYRLARLYQAAGKKDEAKAEFDKTRNIDKAANATVFNKLHEQAAGEKPATEEPTAPAPH